MVTPLHFVLSAPRSGSTWLAKSLNYHPEVFATEHRLFGDFCEIWPNNDGTQSPRITFDAYAKAVGVHYLFEPMGLSRPEFLETFQKSYINFLCSFATRKSNKRVVVDKVTPYLGTCKKVIQQITRLLPESRIILLMRDGRDVLTSGTFDWLQREGPDSDRYRFLISRTSSVPPKRFFDDAVITQWANHWKEVAECSRSIDLAATIRYESMKQNHVDQLQAVFKSLDVDADQSIAQVCAESTTFEKTTGRSAGNQVKTDKARKGISGDWRNYFTRADGELFAEIAGDELAQFGYESDKSWVSALPASLTWTSEMLN